MGKSALGFKIILLQPVSGVSFWGHQSVCMSCVHLGVRLRQVSRILLKTEKLRESFVSPHFKNHFLNMGRGQRLWQHFPVYTRGSCKSESLQMSTA